jgi:ubiquinone/menaquinone biosynthesis C-methylase UbiE
MKRKVFIENIPFILAPLYEKAAGMAMENYYDLIAREIAAGISKGRILDLGTGPGYLPAAVVRLAPELRIVGIDLSGRLIRTARANAIRLGLAERLYFQKGNAARLNFVNGSFDMVISTGMLHMLRNPGQVLRECYRVLKDKGEAWIYDPAQVSTRIDKKVWKASLTPFERYAFRFFKIYTFINPGYTYEVKEVEKLITAETAFTILQIEKEESELKIKLKK